MKKIKNHHKAISRYFPAYHPRAGEHTHFIEKVIKGIEPDSLEITDELNSIIDFDIQNSCEPKLHTIRDGSSVKVGDTLSLYTWSGRPYHSPQILFAKNVKVKKVWDFEIGKDGVMDGEYYLQGKLINTAGLKLIAKNDGLHVDDLECWFNSKKYYRGQIICWDKSIVY